MTAPYFHDGSVATLPAAVRVMAKVQLGRELTDQQVKDIVSFLDSLTGSLPKDFAEAPILPPGAFPGSLPAASSAD
jgi:cytochrome c peroxidase